MDRSKCRWYHSLYGNKTLKWNAYSNISAKSFKINSFAWRGKISRRPHPLYPGLSGIPSLIQHSINPLNIHRFVNASTIRHQTIHYLCHITAENRVMVYFCSVYWFSVKRAIKTPRLPSIKNWAWQPVMISSVLELFILIRSLQQYLESESGKKIPRKIDNFRQIESPKIPIHSNDSLSPGNLANKEQLIQFLRTFSERSLETEVRLCFKNACEHVDKRPQAKPETPSVLKMITRTRWVY